MPRTKSNATTIQRAGTVTGWRADVNLYAHADPHGNRARTSGVTLDLFGEFSEPVKGVSRFNIMVVPGTPTVGQAEIPSVGSFIKAKLVLEGVVELTVAEFQAVWALAVSGQLVACSATFMPPRYGHGLISSIGFSSSPAAPE